MVHGWFQEGGARQNLTGNHPGGEQNTGRRASAPVTDPCYTARSTITPEPLDNSPARLRHSPSLVPKCKGGHPYAR